MKESLWKPLSRLKSAFIEYENLITKSEKYERFGKRINELVELGFVNDTTRNCFCHPNTPSSLFYLFYNQVLELSDEDFNNHVEFLTKVKTANSENVLKELSSIIDKAFADNIEMKADGTEILNSAIRSWNLLNDKSFFSKSASTETAGRFFPIDDKENYHEEDVHEIATAKFEHKIFSDVRVMSYTVDGTIYETNEEHGLALYTNVRITNSINEIEGYVSLYSKSKELFIHHDNKIDWKGVKVMIITDFSLNKNATKKED